MKRIFPSQFRKSILSMSQSELQSLNDQLTKLRSSFMDKDEYEVRLILTSITSLRFKVNSPKYTIEELIEEGLIKINKRLKPATALIQRPSIQQPVAEPKTTKSNQKQPKATAPQSNTDAVANSSLFTLHSSKDFPSPLITGPLHHEALHVQELYYLPLAQLHNQLFILVQQAIKQAVNMGWKGEDVKTWKPSAATPSLTGRAGEGLSPFAPNAERSSLQQRITKLDNQLQNFWNRYHLALDEINGTEISEETRAQLDKETKACDSPSLSAANPPSQGGQGGSPKSLGSYTKKEILAGLIPADISLEEVITARQDRNKKLLRRRDRQKTEAHKATVLEAATELHEWNIYIEPAQERTCAYYGITLPQDWLRPVLSDEEKKASHNASQKRSYSKKTALQREMRAAFKAEEQTLFESSNPRTLE